MDINYNPFKKEIPKTKTTIKEHKSMGQICIIHKQEKEENEFLINEEQINEIIQTKIEWLIIIMEEKEKQKQIPYRINKRELKNTNEGRIPIKIMEEKRNEEWQKYANIVKET